MTYLLLDAELVEGIHDKVLNPGELPGLALDKSLEGALGRVDNRLYYGMIEDIFDLAAAYAQAVEQANTQQFKPGPAWRQGRIVKCG